MNTDNYYFLVILVVLIAVAAVLFVWLRRDRTLPRPDRDETLPPAPPRATEPDRQVTAAEALVDPIAPVFPEAVGAEPPRPVEPAAPAALPVEAGSPDTLTTLKGLGPKAAARLNELGITRYDQLAALSGDALATIDAQMGAFQGRIIRDRWVEQAGHLAAGDVAGFEAKFGKIGG
jgi:predicted flap endonuclease-1-like 5' DNA nuclease